MLAIVCKLGTKVHIIIIINEYSSWNYCFLGKNVYLCRINTAKVLTLDKKKNNFFCFVLA